MARSRASRSASLSLLRAYNIADMEALARILSRLTLKEAPTPDGMYETGVQLVQSAIRSNPAFVTGCARTYSGSGWFPAARRAR